MLLALDYLGTSATDSISGAGAETGAAGVEALTTSGCTASSVG